MERQLWKLIVSLLEELDKSRTRREGDFADRRIVAVYYWGVVHDRPVHWSVQRRNWPIDLRRWPLPSNTTMSRRLRSKSVRCLLEALEQRVVRKPESSSLVWLIDGKPSPSAERRKIVKRGMAERHGAKPTATKSTPCWAAITRWPIGGWPR